MRFLFVDRIDQARGDAVRGCRAFGAAEPLQYAPVRGRPEVAPGAVSEAIGQLASWLCLEHNGFAARPVFLFAQAIDVLAPVPVGAEVELIATIAAMDAETLTFSGEARVGGVVVQRLTNCSGYFMPLAELEDPEVTRQRYAALRAGGLQLEGAEGPPFRFDTLVDDVQTLTRADAATGTPGEIRAFKTFAMELPFYADHFPRFPVTPIVMLNETIGAAATRLLCATPGQRLRVRSIRDIKIKSFVRPGETCEIRVTTRAAGAAPADAATRHGGAVVTTVAELLKGGKRILRGTYDFEITE